MAVAIDYHGTLARQAHRFGRTFARESGLFPGERELARGPVGRIGTAREFLDAAGA